MRSHYRIILCGASLSAIASSSQAFAQAVPQDPAPTPVTAPSEDQSNAVIVVTGIRSSLERAATIKRNSIQVVDSVVATDIGKFPDSTVAAALQRVPGVQVQNNNNNELAGVRIRGLTDILTTIDGREVFSTTDRSFNLQDLPAEALARVDVFKSQTADLIEGGVAGAIDLKLNKPFNFRKPTVVLSARNNYATRLGTSNPQLGLLVTDRWSTGIGEIGALLNATYQKSNVQRAQSNLTDRRSSNSTPFNVPGYLIPEVFQNQVDVGDLTRKQINGALQWKITPELQAYIGGLYATTYNTIGFVGFNGQPFNTNVQISNVQASSDCFNARVTAAGQNPNIVNNANGTTTLQPYTVQHLCDIKSATFSNIVINQNSNSQIFDTANKMVAGGFRYDKARLNANVDIGYQTSRTINENINTTMGQRVSSVTLETDYDGGMRLTVPEQVVLSGANDSIRNQLNQNYSDQRGSLFQARADFNYEVGGILSKLQTGFRFAKREATLQAVQQSTPNPYGNVGTATEGRARLISSLPLDPSFLAIVAFGPRINDGTDFLGINPAFLRSETGRTEIRAVFGAAPGRPAYDPTRQFDADEKTYAAYVQADYDIGVAPGVSLDGVVGVRATKTDRTIGTFSKVGTVITPTEATTSDTDILPNAVIRLKLPGGFQSRISYSKAIRRPDFASLNPSVALTIQNNPLLLNTGSAGNPDLRPQKSDSYDATLEYYVRSGFIAATVYYRNLRDRVITASTQETINGTNYLISRPRNVGEAQLKGLEVSGQYFFDFLPGALSGIGVMGAFTIADSEIKQKNDPLTGYPLLGVSKYNYTAGLLFERHGISARVVYTYRSRYYNNDLTGQTTVRPYDTSRPVTDVYLPTLLNYIRPAGRLDFSIGYDINERLRVDIGGTNVLRNETKSYNGLQYLNNSIFGDETTYTMGVRFKL
nr:TonB-dependent receptor [Sphingomonas sp.]